MLGRIIGTIMSIFIGLMLAYLGDVANQEGNQGLSIASYISSGIIGIGGVLAVATDYTMKNKVE